MLGDVVLREIPLVTKGSRVWADATHRRAGDLEDAVGLVERGCEKRAHRLVRV